MRAEGAPGKNATIWAFQGGKRSHTRVRYWQITSSGVQVRSPEISQKCCCTFVALLLHFFRIVALLLHFSIFETYEINSWWSDLDIAVFIHDVALFVTILLILRRFHEARGHVALLLHFVALFSRFPKFSLMKNYKSPKYEGSQVIFGTPWRSKNHVALFFRSGACIYFLVWYFLDFWNLLARQVSFWAQNDVALLLHHMY